MSQGTALRATVTTATVSLVVAPPAGSDTSEALVARVSLGAQTVTGKAA